MCPDITVIPGETPRKASFEFEVQYEMISYLAIDQFVRKKGQFAVV
jgi:hypothetical protein